MHFGAQNKYLTWFNTLVWYIGGNEAFKKLWYIILLPGHMLFLLTGNSILADYWERIKLPALLTWGLAMWITLVCELWSDVPLPRISFKKHLLVYHLSLCLKISIFQIGAAPSAEKKMKNLATVLTYKRHNTWLRNTPLYMCRDLG